MVRVVFPVVVLCALFVLVSVISHTVPRPAAATLSFELSDPDAHLDVEGLRTRTKNRSLRLADDETLEKLRRASLSDLVRSLLRGPPRERRVVGALLGASGDPDAARALVTAFERETDPRTLSSLALALAESRRRVAVEALVRAIRERQGITAYEACRALQRVFGVRLGLDADAWERWFEATRATRD